MSPLEPLRIAIGQKFVFIDVVEEAKKSGFDPTRLLKVNVHVVLYNVSFHAHSQKCPLWESQSGLQWT